jgi:RNA polymerase sigma factor (sigma-70 family)
MNEIEKEISLVNKVAEITCSRDIQKEFVVKYADIVYKAVGITFRRYRHISSPDIEDVFQEVFKTLFSNNRKALKAYDPQKSRFTTYLVTIARNKAMKHLEKYGDVMNELPDTLECEEISQDNFLIQQEQKELLKALLNDLTVKEKLFYQLYFEQALPEDDIGRILGVDTGTVYSKKAKIIEKLKKMRVEKEKAGV